MRLSVVLFVGLLVSVACVRAQEFEEEAGDSVASYSDESPVVTLTGDDFEAELSSLPRYVLVEFFAPWCGHCKHLKPAFEAAAGLVKEQGMDSVALAAIDATVASDVSTKYNVKGFPTLKLFENGKELEEYEGQRDVQSIVEYLDDLMSPAVKELSTEEDVQKFKGSDGDMPGSSRLTTVIGHFHESNAPAQKAYHDACESMRSDKKFKHVKCGEITSPSTAQLFGVGESPAVKVLYNFPDVQGGDPEFDFFSEEGFNTDKVTAWLKSYSIPLLAEITPNNYVAYESLDLPILWLFLPGHGSAPITADEEDGAVPNAPEIEAANKKHKAAVGEAMKKYVGKVAAVILSGEEYEEHAKSLGVDTENLPGLSIMKLQGRDKFAFDQSQPVDAAHVGKFVAGFFDGTLTPFVLSEDVPESNDGAVKIVVGKTFDEIVYDNDDDVFIEFYAPWCGHCQKAAPAYEELADMLRFAKGITIAKIDATANDVPEAITGFPMFYFSKGSNKEHSLDESMFYNGPHTPESWLEFIRKHTNADLSSLPANIGKIEDFIEQFESFKTEVQQLIKENKRLRSDLNTALGIENVLNGDDNDKAREGAPSSHDEL